MEIKPRVCVLYNNDATKDIIKMHQKIILNKINPDQWMTVDVPEMDVRAAAKFQAAKFIFNILISTKRFVYAIPLSFVQIERLIELEIISQQII